MMNRTQAARVRAFTLIELLLVMVILVVLSSIVVPQFTKQRERANITKVKTDIHLLGTALSAFQIDCGRFPTNDEGLAALAKNPGLPNWNGPYINLVPIDPWSGASYIYLAPGEHFPDSFDLYSMGPDKQDGNEDDIGNWQS